MHSNMYDAKNSHDYWWKSCRPWWSDDDDVDDDEDDDEEEDDGLINTDDLLNDCLVQFADTVNIKSPVKSMWCTDDLTISNSIWELIWSQF